LGNGKFGKQASRLGDGGGAFFGFPPLGVIVFLGHETLEQGLGGAEPRRVALAMQHQVEQFDECPFERLRGEVFAAFRRRAPAFGGQRRRDFRDAAGHGKDRFCLSRGGEIRAQVAVALSINPIWEKVNMNL
jgi:hypothetical protein